MAMQIAQRGKDGARSCTVERDKGGLSKESEKVAPELQPAIEKAHKLRQFLKSDKQRDADLDENLHQVLLWLTSRKAYLDLEFPKT